MTRKILAFVAFLTMASIVLAQNLTESILHQDNASKGEKAAMGTFQLVQKTKIMEALNDELLITIESKRAEDKVIYFDLSPNTQVMILSRQEIGEPGFKPLEDLYFTESK